MSRSHSYRFCLGPGPILGVLALIISLVIFLSCAEIGAPPGGEEDKLGPFLIGSVPGNGELNVAPTDRITILFSEPLIEPRSKSVFISPRPDVEPKVRFKADRIEIELAEPFAPDRTYIISLHSQITDRRRNRIDSLTSIAFSTGDEIDSGSIAGTVLNLGSKPLDGKPAIGALVGLWNNSRMNDTTTIDSIYPDYLATTSKEGKFQFKFLPSESYQLVAFVDRNKDERLNPTNEPLALPDRPVTVGGERSLDKLVMRLNEEDTTDVSILSASYTSDHLVRVRLSGLVKTTQFMSDSISPYLRPTDDTTAQIKLVSFREESKEAVSLVNFYFGSLAQGQYDLFLPADGDTEPLRYSGLNVRGADDTTPPKIEKRTPDEKPVFAADADISFLFSEMIDTARITDQTITLWNAEDEMIPLVRHWTNPFELGVSARLQGSGLYRLTLSEFDIIDLSGNLLGDSLVDFRINLLDDDSLGSISGRVIIEDTAQSDRPLLIEFLKLDNKQTFDQVIDQGQFHIELPAGKYLMWGLIDADRDGLITDGRWSPFRHSETMAVYPDTIKVRARFETSGIEFRIE